MKKYISVMFLVALVATTFGQGKNNKGKFYVYWGWNHAQYTKSDIQFKGDGYDFTLERGYKIPAPKPAVTLTSIPFPFFVIGKC